MPLVQIKYSANQIVTGFWHLSESLPELAGLADLSEQENSTYLSWKNLQRQKQWVGARALVKSLMAPFSAKIGYATAGKPVFENHSSFLSISHSGDYVAVAVSEKNPVGIDIEIIHPRIRKISSKFLNNKEIEALGEQPSLLSLYYYWCSKEALFKAHPVPCPDFRNSIYVHPIDYLCMGKQAGHAEVSDNSGITKYNLIGHVIRGLVMVTCFQNNQ